MTQPRRYRLLATDVDGTILRSDGRLSPDVATAVKEGCAKGLEIVLCSGRRFRKALPIVEALDLRSPVVINSGTVIKDPRTRENLRAEYIDQGLAARIVSDLIGYEIALTVHVDSDLDDIDFFVPSTANAPDFFLGYLEHNRDLWEPGQPGEHRFGARITVICAAGDPPFLRELGRKLAREYDGGFNHHVVSNVGYVGEFLEIYSPEASKWKAVSWIADARGIEHSELAAVGDDENDLEMIENAGLGAAVANAAPGVMAAASMHIPSNDDDGIVALIDHILSHPLWTRPPGP